MRAAPACLLALGLAGPAMAAPSSLATIPTADVVPPRQWVVQLQNGNTALEGAGRLLQQPEPAFQAQAGLPGARLEGGVDLVAVDSPSDYRPVVNLKVLLLPEGYDWPAVAAGIAPVGRDMPGDGYVVVTRTLDYAALQYRRFRAHHRNLKLRGVRAHAGLLGRSSDLHALAGADVETFDHLVLQADWISGSGRSATLGGTWILGPQASVQASLMRGNDSHRLDGLQVGLTRQFAW